jgi:hypothetical protein
MECEKAQPSSLLNDTICHIKFEKKINKYHQQAHETTKQHCCDIKNGNMPT